MIMINSKIITYFKIPEYSIQTVDVKCIFIDVGAFYNFMFNPEKQAQFLRENETDCKKET